jgi:hypothetical protein
MTVKHNNFDFFLQDMNVHYHVLKSLPMVFILNQINPAKIVTPYFSKNF